MSLKCAGFEAARAYIQRGFYVVPIPSGKNHPTIQVWQKMQLRTKDVKKAFSNASGIGLLLKPSDMNSRSLQLFQASEMFQTRSREWRL